ncbi:amino acid permease [Ancylostoma ceylanicum]|uniref:Amino acid permease n=1 Tax=Ancylostoma ceylanicum TaxID=53326 RepID=A0A0D6LLK6_9BILA|nr:amino acid permease [Ancylostoma ceylanicum]
MQSISSNMKTIEHPPIMDFYRNSVDVADGSGAVRPSMLQLIHGDKAIPEEIEIEGFKAAVLRRSSGSQMLPPPARASGTARVKFGWIQGVFVRCLLNIFGVMLYLRISWVAGQAGIETYFYPFYILCTDHLRPGLGSVIVLLASLVTSITAISTCAICTNGDVKGGGAYFLVPTCVILMGIVFIGTAFESKMQIGLLVILVASIIDYMVGSVFPPNEGMIVRGATGYKMDTMLMNLWPSFRGEDFFSVFAVYFPAATGIMAGANISGDLADPQRAIPIGTLLAIGVTTVIYLATVWMTGSTCVRDADGLSAPMWNNSIFVPPDCAANKTCPYGLMNYYQVLGISMHFAAILFLSCIVEDEFQIMEMESLWGPLIVAGIFAATLSSALASLVSAPKVFQVCTYTWIFM